MRDCLLEPRWRRYWQRATVTRRYKVNDKAIRAHGSQIPDGALVTVLRFYPRRRALIDYGGRSFLAMLWCLRKEG